LESARPQLQELRDLIRKFVDERDWDQFHTPKNLSMALSVEVAELLEHFQWLKTGSPSELKEGALDQIKLETADILVYLIRFADKLEIDLEAAVIEKLKLNSEKYPADKVRGDSRKYNEY
jgi:dCTP diphosphatase